MLLLYISSAGVQTTRTAQRTTSLRLGRHPELLPHARSVLLA